METLLHIGLSNTLLATALAVVAAAASALTRRPALAHGLWLLVLLKLVTPPFVHLPVLPSPADVPAEEVALLKLDEFPQIEPPAAPAGDAVPEAAWVEDRPATTAQVPAEAIAWAPGWLTVLGGLWLVGSAGWFLLAVTRVVRFRRLLRHAKPVPPELRLEIGGLAERLGLRRCPEARFVPGAVSPMLWSLGGPPLLLFPFDLWDRLTDEQRQTLVVHELAHLARHDHWVRGLEFLATGLYWWNPLAWWARHGLREAEERCCDAWVVWALPGAARAYATALVETIDFLSEARPALPAAASGIGHVRILKRRLTMILHGTTPRALSATGFLGLAALAVLLLPLLPTWAQEPTVPPVPPRVKVLIQTIDEQDAVKQRLEAMLHVLREAGADANAKERAAIIAELKRTLAELEARRAADASEEGKKKAQEIEKARAEVREAEERLRAAKARLAALEGSHMGIRIKVNPLGKNPIPTQQFQQRIQKAQPMRIAAPGAPKPPRTQPGTNEERLDRLEKQLGELLREVKELRKQAKSKE